MEPGARPFFTRVAARAVTGPLGHLYGGLIDWALLAGRYAWARARRRDPGTLV